METLNRSDYRSLDRQHPGGPQQQQRQQPQPAGQKYVERPRPQIAISEIGGGWWTRYRTRASSAASSLGKRCSSSDHNTISMQSNCIEVPRSPYLSFGGLDDEGDATASTTATELTLFQRSTLSGQDLRPLQSAVSCPRLSEALRHSACAMQQPCSPATPPLISAGPFVRSTTFDSSRNLRNSFRSSGTHVSGSAAHFVVKTTTALSVLDYEQLNHVTELLGIHAMQDRPAVSMPHARHSSMEISRHNALLQASARVAMHPAPQADAPRQRARSLSLDNAPPQQRAAPRSPMKRAARKSSCLPWFTHIFRRRSSHSCPSNASPPGSAPPAAAPCACSLSCHSNRSWGYIRSADSSTAMSLCGSPSPVGHSLAEALALAVMRHSGTAATSCYSSVPGPQSTQPPSGSSISQGPSIPDGTRSEHAAEDCASAASSALVNIALPPLFAASGHGAPVKPADPPQMKQNATSPHAAKHTPALTDACGMSPAFCFDLPRRTGHGGAPELTAHTKPWWPVVIDGVLRRNGPAAAGGEAPIVALDGTISSPASQSKSGRSGSTPLWARVAELTPADERRELVTLLARTILGPQHAQGDLPHDAAAKTGLLSTGARLRGCGGSLTPVSPDDLRAGVLPMLSDLDNDWDAINPFKMKVLFGDNALTISALLFIGSQSAFAHLSIDYRRLSNFLMDVQACYTHAPYHNVTHALHVLWATHRLMQDSGLANILGALDVLACYVVAVCHDVGHQGTNSDFLQRMRADASLVFGLQSPLERAHVAIFSVLMQIESNNFLPTISPEDWSRLMDRMMALTTGTDMKLHLEVCSMFAARPEELKQLARDASFSRAERTASGLQQPRALWWPRVEYEVGQVCVENLLTMLLKCADLSHVAAVSCVHEAWVYRLEEECWRQGDLELKLGCQPQPLFNRLANVGISTTQVGFLMAVAQPMYADFIECFPDCSYISQRLSQNLDMWSERRARHPPMARSSIKCIADAQHLAACPEPATGSIAGFDMSNRSGWRAMAGDAHSL